MAVQTGIGSGKAKSVGVYANALYIEGLRIGPVLVPFADVLHVVHAPAPAGAPAPRVQHVALVLRAALGKSDLVLLSCKPGEVVPTLASGPGAAGAAAAPDSGSTDAVLAAVLSALARVKTQVAERAVPAHLKTTEGVLCFLKCGVLFLTKVVA